MFWHPAGLVLTCALLAACASRPQRSGRRDLRLDSETAAKVTHASVLIEGSSSATATTTATVASILGQSVPALLALLENDNAAGELETVSKEEEVRLIAQRCTRELWRTIEPDIVLHANRSSLLRSVLTLDFKFPCPDTNQPQWTRYGEDSAYASRTQGEIYKEALGGEARIISPRRGISQ
ncbi:MAG: hypothetical protein JXB05_35665 [Myxococcaceae bacterium]|nr:hypothetical protein [Myxococcaceae bacterium]